MLDDAHGNVRLQSHQPARRIGEGDDPFAFEKVFILPVQVISYKIAHPVAAVAALLEQSAQKQRHLFVFRQTSRFNLHWRLPPLFCGAGGPGKAGSRFRRPRRRFRPVRPLRFP